MSEELKPTEQASEAPTPAPNPIQDVIDKVDITGATPHHIIAELVQAINQLSVRAQITVGIAQKIFMRDVEGVKGQISAFIQHADEDTLDLTHKLLSSRVTIPEPVQPVQAPTEVEATPTNVIPITPVTPEEGELINPPSALTENAHPATTEVEATQVEKPE